MKKNFYSFVIFLVCLLVLPNYVRALGNTSNPEYTFSNGVSITKQGAIFANGHSIVIKEAPGGACFDSSDAVHIDLDETACQTAGHKWYRYSLIYVDGSTTPMDLNMTSYTDATYGNWAPGEFAYSQVVLPATNTAVATSQTNTTNGFNLFDSTIVGGSKNQDLTSNTSVTLEGGTVYSIVGGNYAYADATNVYNANLVGNTSVTIYGGKVMYEIIAGNKVGYSGTVTNYATANLTGNTMLTIKNFTPLVNPEVYIDNYLQDGKGTESKSGKSTLKIASNNSAFGELKDTDIIYGDINNLIIDQGIACACNNVTVTDKIEVNNYSSLTVNKEQTAPINTSENGSVANNTGKDIKVYVNNTELTIKNNSTALTMFTNETEPFATLNFAYDNTGNIISLIKKDLTTGSNYDLLLAAKDTNQKVISSFDLYFANFEENPATYTISSDKMHLILNLGTDNANKSLTILHLVGETIEKHTVTADTNGKAAIDVTSLSPFMVLENPVVTNPATVDNIIFYVATAITSTIGLIGIAVYIKKQRYE